MYSFFVCYTLYKEILTEELTYRHSDTQGPEDDEYEIGMREDYSHNLSFNNKLELSDEEKNSIKNVTAEQLIINQGEFDGSSATLHINMPWKSPINNSNGVNVNFEVIDGVLYQIHIFLSPSVRGLGLGYKIFKALVNDFGHVLARKSGSMNKNEIPKIILKRFLCLHIMLNHHDKFGDDPFTHLKDMEF